MCVGIGVFRQSDQQVDSAYTLNLRLHVRDPVL